MTQRPYFSFARRDGDRVVRDYIGSKQSPAVQILVRRERLKDATTKAAASARSAESRNYEVITNAIDQYTSQRAALVKAWLQVQSLRIGKDGTIVKIQKQGTRDMPIEATVTKDDIEHLVKRSEKGDAEATRELRHIMWEDRDTWRPFGDLSELVRRQYLSLMTRGNVIAAESLRMSLAELANSLKPDKPSVIRDLVADEVLMCYLDFHYHQILVTQSSGTSKEVEQLEKRLTRSQRRYQTALQSLNDMNVQIGIQSIEVAIPNPVKVNQPTSHA